MHKKIVSRLLASSFAAFLLLLGGNATGESFSGIGSLITEPVAKFAESKAQSLLPANFVGAREVRLGAVTATEIEDLKKLNANSNGPLAVGFARALPEVLFLTENALYWVTLQDGSKVTQVKITSPGASSLRLQLDIVKMDDGVELKFIGNGMPAEMADPVTVQNIPDPATYWSPTTSGDTVTFEIYLPSKSTNGFVATISRLSHFATNPGSPDRAKVTAASLSCEVDVACANNTNVNTVANAVAAMTFQKNGTSYVCTGTLLNNSNFDRTPYFLTAAHCISDQATANTLQTSWFYRAATCGGTASSVALSGGAALLHTSADLDVTLLRLNHTPPSGVSFLGWSPAPVGLGSAVFGIHHPNRDSAKISVGTVVSTNHSVSTNIGNFNNFLGVGWDIGLVEGGSSGSALLTYDTARVTGTLTAGPANQSCSQSPQWAAYSPFSSVYPSLARWLQPAATQITPQSGWWWNPSESGRGFSIEVSGNHLFMAGYLYASDTGQAIWFSSGGNMSSSSAYQGTMAAYGNGQTLTGSYVAPTPAVNIGTISLNFTDATHGTLTWPGGTISIERFNIVANGVNSPRASFQPETGWWYSPGESGRGFALEIQNGVMFLAGYMYEGGGRPIWFSSANQMSSPSLYQGNWVLYANGQTLYGAYRPPVVANSNVGPLQIQFQTTTSGTLTLPDGRVIPISRFRF